MGTIIQAIIDIIMSLFGGKRDNEPSSSPSQPSRPSAPSAPSTPSTKPSDSNKPSTPTPPSTPSVPTSNRIITNEQMKSIFGSNIAKYVESLQTVMNKYEINTPLRVSAFLAQVAHESQTFARTSENLNYSAQGLLNTFGSKYFSVDQANAYARQPEKIANRVYANRMGNGNEASGDGWKFRGRGLIQLTGRETQTAFAKEFGYTADTVQAYLDTPDGAAMSAGWFWNSRKLNNLADKPDFVEITRKINGGTNGLAERQAWYEKVKNVLISNK